jgi:hypothetical protein
MSVTSDHKTGFFDYVLYFFGVIIGTLFFVALAMISLVIIPFVLLARIIEKKP